MSTGWKIGIVAGLCWLGKRIYDQVQQIMVDVSSLKLVRFGLEDLSATLSIDLIIDNPLDVGVLVKSLQGDVYLSGVPVGVINTQYDYFLSGHTHHEIPIYIDVTAERLGNALWANITSGNINNMALDIDATVYATKLGVPVPVQLHYDWNEIKG